MIMYDFVILIILFRQAIHIIYSIELLTIFNCLYVNLLRVTSTVGGEEEVVGDRVMAEQRDTFGLWDAEKRGLDRRLDASLRDLP